MSQPSALQLATGWRAQMHRMPAAATSNSWKHTKGRLVTFRSKAVKSAKTVSRSGMVAVGVAAMWVPSCGRKAGVQNASVPESGHARTKCCTQSMLKCSCKVTAMGVASLTGSRARYYSLQFWTPDPSPWRATPARMFGQGSSLMSELSAQVNARHS